MATLSSAECRNQCRVVDKLKSAAAASAWLWRSPTVAGGSCQGQVRGYSVVACGVPVSLPHCSWLALQDLLLSEGWAPGSGQDLCSVSCGRGKPVSQ